MDTNSRDKIVAVERKHYRRRNFWSFIGVSVAFGGAVLTALAEHKYPLPQILIDDPPIAFFGGTFIGLAIIILAWVCNRRPQGADADEVTQRQIETYQNRYRWFVLFLGFMPLVMAVVLNVLPVYLPGYFQADPSSTRLFVVIVLCTMPYIAFEIFRPTGDTPANFNDELFRDLRLKAVRIGYVAVMTALTAAFVWFLWHPEDCRFVLPWLLAAGVAIPAVVFVFLHWRAGREASDDER